MVLNKNNGKLLKPFRAWFPQGGVTLIIAIFRFLLKKAEQSDQYRPLKMSREILTSARRHTGGMGITPALSGTLHQ